MAVSAINSDSLGVDDRVEIRIGNDTVTIYSQYDITHSVFNSPSSFTARLGNDKVVAQLIKKYPPRTPFQVRIGGRPIFSGYTEGFKAGGAESQLSLHGKCIMERLRKFYVEKDQAFNAKSYHDLVTLALNDVELQKPFAPPGTRPTIISSNGANRAIITATDVPAEDDTSDAALAEIAGSRGNKYSCIRTKAGERMLDLLRRELDAGGLFMWASGEGDIIVGRPNARQPAIYRILRTKGWFDDGGKQRPQFGCVENASFDVDWSERYADIAVIGRSTGRKKFRSTAKGAFTDDELVSAGVKDTWVVHDSDCTSLRQAEHLAALKHADARRKGFKLEYTMSGHSQIGCGPAKGRRVVWTPDTVVEVYDEIFGLEGPYYIETVKHEAAPHSLTHLTLVEPLAITFAEGTTAA